MGMDTVSSLALDRSYDRWICNQKLIQPYATLTVAAGVGYVLGGGVPTAALRMLMGVGGRLAVGHVIARLVADSVDT